jgi:hypothetical protein
MEAELNTPIMEIFNGSFPKDMAGMKCQNKLELKLQNAN